MAQTAVEWLENELDFLSNYIDESARFNLFQQAKAMEKNQIEESFNSGLAYDYDESETYYNKTYNK